MHFYVDILIDLIYKKRASCETLFTPFIYLEYRSTLQVFFQ